MSGNDMEPSGSSSGALLLEGAQYGVEDPAARRQLESVLAAKGWQTGSEAILIPATPWVGPPARSLAGSHVTVLAETDRFEIRRCLGSGAFGIVYEAFDRERQARVALKFPHAGTAQGLYLFKREFRSLADLVHPNLIVLFELLTDREQWFFTMELVDGVPWLAYLRSGPGGAAGDLPTGSGGENSGFSSSGLSAWTGGGRPSPSGLRIRPEEPEPVVLPSLPPDLARVRNALGQLSEGLVALHEAGMLHRDLKPSNVLVTPSGRVVILDFGLVADLEFTAQNEASAGTPAYMSPEQLAGKATSEASDWYSVGVLLYQALTGRLPFTGNSRSLLVQKLRQEPLAPRFLVPETPEDLDRLCMDLLRRDPARRLQGREVLQRLHASAPLPAAPKPLPPPRAAALVGREKELGILVEGFRLARAGRSVVALLHGSSGSGKTSLARGFLKELQRLDDRVVLLQGRCYEQETVPFKALDSLVDALSQHLKRLPVPEVQPLLPRNLPALARLFPVLNQVPIIAELPAGDEVPDAQELRRRAFGALREVLRRMVGNHPVVLAIDDLQWGDLDSAALLAELLRPPDPPPVMLLLCYRNEDAGTSPMLGDLLPRLASSATSLQDVDLQVLTPTDAQALARSLLGAAGPDAAAQAEWIATESGGSPFFVQELAQHFRHIRLDSRESGKRRLDDYIRTRVEHLEAGPRRLLQTLALAGSPLDWELLQRVLGAETGALPAVAALRSGHLIRMRASDRHRILETYHDRIRTAVAHSIPFATAREIHLALATALESSPAPDVQALARHFEEAGLLAKASTYVLQAAAQAESALAFDQAALLYRKALALQPAVGSGMASLWKRLGDALANSGRSVESAEAYLRATEGAAAGEISRLQRRAAEEFLRGGSMEKGLAALQQVLVQAGARLPSTKLGALFSLLRNRLKLKLRGLDFRPCPENQAASGELERVDTHWAVAMGLGPVDVLRAADFQTRQLLLTLDCGEPFRVVRALAHETILVAATGHRALRATQALQDRTFELAERIGHPNPRARALLAAGIAATMQGRWKASAELLEQAEATLKQHCTGMDYELHIAQHQALVARYVMGDLRLLQERLPQALQEAREKGDLIASTNLRLSLAPVLHLMQDRPDLAAAELQGALEAWSYHGFQLQHYHHLVNQVNVQLYAGGLEAARKTLAGVRKDFNRSLLKRLQIVRITDQELRGRAALAEGGAPGIAAREIRALRRERMPYAEALALKLEALAAALQGRTGEAHSLLTRAGRLFEACDMLLHAQVAQCGCGLLEGNAGRIGTAHRWLRMQGIRVPERFVAMHFPLGSRPS